MSKSLSVTAEMIDKALQLVNTPEYQREFKARSNTREEEVRRDTSGAEVIMYDYKTDTSTYYTRQHYDIPQEELLPIEQRLENDIQRRYAEIDSSLEAAGEMIEMVNDYQQSIDVIMRDLFIG